MDIGSTQAQNVVPICWQPFEKLVAENTHANGIPDQGPLIEALFVPELDNAKTGIDCCVTLQLVHVPAGVPTPQRLNCSRSGQSVYRRHVSIAGR